MRLRMILAIAILLTPPAALTARPAQSGLHGIQLSDLSAGKKKQKKAKAPKEEYLKAAPGTGPSGPKK